MPFRWGLFSSIGGGGEGRRTCFMGLSEVEEVGGCLRFGVELEESLLWSMVRFL